MSRRTALTLAAILGVAAVLRFYDLGGPGFWIDEANTYWIASAAPSQLFAMLAEDASPPLYYLLLHGFMRLAGESEVSLRGFGAGLAIGLCALCFVVGRAWISEAAGLWAALVVALSPGQIFYSRQVRMYTLIPVLFLLSTYLLVCYLRRPGRRSGAAYAVVTAMALWTHNFAMYLLPTHLLLVLGAGDLRRRLAAHGLVAAGVLALYLPWLPTFLQQLTTSDTYTWFEPIWKTWDRWDPLWQTLGAFSPESAILAHHHYQPLQIHGLSRWLFAGLFVLGAVVLVRRGASDAPGRFEGLALLALVLVPLLGAIALSSLLLPHYVAGRVSQTFFPAFALLVGAGAASVPWRSARLALGALVVIVGACTAIRNLPLRGDLDPANDTREVARFIRGRMAPQDRVVVVGLEEPSLSYYLRDLTGAGRVIGFPEARGERLAVWPEAMVAPRRERLASEARTLVLRLLSEGGSSSRTGPRSGPKALGPTLFVVLLEVPVAKVLRETLTRLPGLREVAPAHPYVQLGTGIRAEVRQVQLSTEPPGPQPTLTPLKP